jgi:WD40 repeat protein
VHVADAAVEAKPIAEAASIAPTSRLRARDATRLAFADARHLAWAADESLDVTVLDVTAKRTTLHLRGAPRAGVDSEGVTALAASSASILTAALGGIRSWDAKTGKPLREFLAVDPHRAIKQLARLSDDTVVASVIPDRGAPIGQSTMEIRRWAPDGTAIFVATLPTVERWGGGGARGFALSPDGSQLATGMDQVVVFDGKSGALVGKPFGYVKSSGDPSTPTLLAVRWPDSGIVACTSSSFIGDIESRVHVVRSNAEPLTFPAHRGSVERAALLADGRIVTAGHVDQRVTVRSAVGRPECELTGVEGKIWALAVSPDETRVAAATDAELIVWDLARGPARTPTRKRP